MPHLGELPPPSNGAPCDGERSRDGLQTGSHSSTSGTWSSRFLTARFGSTAACSGSSRGASTTPFETHSERKSLGTENTYNVDLADFAAMEPRSTAWPKRCPLPGALGARGLHGDAQGALCRLHPPSPACGPSRSGLRRWLDRPLRPGPPARTEAPSRPVRLLGVTASNLVRERISQLLCSSDPGVRIIHVVDDNHPCMDNPQLSPLSLPGIPLLHLRTDGLTRDRLSPAPWRKRPMLRWALIFLVVALIAGGVRLRGIAPGRRVSPSSCSCSSSWSS